MPIIDFSTDVASRTITITAYFAAPVERVWALYADPRQLEQVWGPEGYPATFVDHELSVGARSRYYMTSPEGERFGGWWQVTAVDAPNGFEFDDGFADADLEPVDSMPVSHNTFRFDADGDGTRLTTTTTYDSEEGIERVIEMGVEEGTRSAMGQIDDVLAGR